MQKQKKLSLRKEAAEYREGYGSKQYEGYLKDMEKIKKKWGFA